MPINLIVTQTESLLATKKWQLFVRILNKNKRVHPIYETPNVYGSNIIAHLYIIFLIKAFLRISIY